MNKMRFLLAFVGMTFMTQDLSAQDRVRYPEAMPGINDAYYCAFDSDNPYATKDMLDHIRHEKFDLVLPRVMRERGVDFASAVGVFDGERGTVYSDDCCHLSQSGNEILAWPCVTQVYAHVA